MSIISSLVAQPNRFIIASEFVHSFGDKGAPTEDLERMLSPLPPQSNQGDEDADVTERSGTTIAKLVLAEMLRLRILEQTENQHLRLSPALAVGERKIDLAGRLYDYLFPILCSADKARAHGQDDLPDALCWLLRQDPTQPLGFSGGQHYDALAAQVVDGDPLFDGIRSDAKYQVVVYWARYLGLVERLTIKPVAEKVIADPTRAIAARLPQIFAGERELTMHTFIQRLGAQIPVLDGGQVWNEMGGRLKAATPAHDHLSQATSFALRRLEHAGKIKLAVISDADAWELQVGRETISPSHITYLETGK
jgi:hypothetical protein